MLLTLSSLFRHPVLAARNEINVIGAKVCVTWSLLPSRTKGNQNQTLQKCPALWTWPETAISKENTDFSVWNEWPRGGAWSRCHCHNGARRSRLFNAMLGIERICLGRRRRNLLYCLERMKGTSDAHNEYKDASLSIFLFIRRLLASTCIEHSLYSFSIVLHLPNL